MTALSIRSSADTRLRLGARLLVLTACIALGLTTWRYFMPLTGINGTPGALLAMFGAFMLVISGLLLVRLPQGGWRNLLLALSWLGAVLTLVAELFLHGWGSAIVLVVGTAGVGMETFARAEKVEP